MLHIGINGRALFRRLTGVQLYSREITRALLALENEDVAFTVFSGREGRASTEAGPPPDLPLETSFFPAGSPLGGMLWEQTILNRMVKKTRVQVLFSPANVAPLHTPVPSVVTIHDLAFLLFPEYYSRTFATYYRQLVPRVARQAAAVITVSRSARDDLIARLGLPSHKISVIPESASPAFKRRITRQELAEVRRRYGLPEKYFLSISSLEPRKNLKGIMTAYRLLPREVAEEHKLVIVGAGNKIFADPGLHDGLRRMTTGSVLTPGYVPSDDLPAIYRMATALVFPSFYEGFGLPVLEAMAASTPVITSNRSSLPEVAGAAAVLIDPGSIEELAAAMELIATDSGTRNLLIERGKKRVANFTWERSAEQTLEVLRNAI